MFSRRHGLPKFSFTGQCLKISLFAAALLWLAAISCNFAIAADVAGIQVVSPPTMAWVSEGKIYMAGMVDDEAITQLKVEGVKTEAAKDMVAVQNGAFGVMLNLKKGMNNIELAAGSHKASLQVYYSPSAGREKDEQPPKNFKRFYVHANQAVSDCKECHRFKRGKFDFKRLIPATSNCTTSGCHDSMAKEAHVHGPVGAGICISCHNPHGSSRVGQVERDGGELCVVCHQAKKTEFDQKVVHPPVAEGCVDCHDPHQSPRRFQLKGEEGPISSLCFRCHEQGMFTKEHRHGPVGSGDCIACHRPHASNNERLLIAPTAGGELCFRCHQDRKSEFTMKQVHPPVEEDCTNCHDPHSAEARFQLNQAVPQLCAGCHEDLSPGVFEDITQAKTKHPPVAEGRCTACHRPHSSNYEPLLAKPMEKLCFTCHIDLGDEVSASPADYRHGPVKTGDCTACHKPHGSPNSRLLIRYFPPEFYNTYNPGDYDLCFGCHNKDIAKNKFTDTLTNFRDGKYNLHYFHVNREKGRTCIACHAPHASDQYKHVRDEVPFGTWSYPINITKNENGGTCVVGCHAPKTYDRKNPKVTPSR